MARFQDVYVRFFGYDVPSQQGAVISKSAPELVDFAKKVNTPEYVARRMPLALIWLVGGEGKGNRVGDVITKMKELETAAGSLGSICITGGSAGGKNALELAGRLTQDGRTVRYVGICDGAFQKADISSDKPLTFKAPSIMCMQKENWFQSWGHTLDPRQELHGRIDGFSNVDVTALTIVQQVVVQHKHGSLDDQEALEAAHVAAYKHGFRIAEEKIAWILANN